ncbi:MAG: hypothetical protein PHU64_00355 [Candidatus Omnitrophica bacterium]|nr:hypothetical protein [Candidatus Omnitrophota bacterium]MDD5429656.1 hypothetical protein [Candidatus Omnitrophota bacterium]
MNYGILSHSEARAFFKKEINSQKLCNECRSARSEFRLKDQKYNSSYSNLLPGFSSSKVKIPIDVLVIAEAHGGGREKCFRKQLSLEKEVTEIGNYYRSDSIEKFHQYEMRKLFKRLDQKGKSWIFADLIRCFVWQGIDIAANLDGRINVQKAIGYCRKYLDKEIAFLKPKKIICLGNKVARDYFGIDERMIHGMEYKYNSKNTESVVIRSYFPSRNTADIWVTVGGWKEILAKI